MKELKDYEYFKTDIGVLYNGSCDDVLPLLEDESIDLIVTSPPYNLCHFQKGSFYHGKTKGETIEYDIHNDEMSEEDYTKWQRGLFEIWYKKIKKTGAIFYNHKPQIKDGVYNDRKNLIPLPIRQELIWDRCGMVNFNGTFFAPNTEKIYIVCKEEWRPVRKYVKEGEVWRVPPEVNTNHPAPFPLKLIQKIVKAGSNEGDVVLDPFMGSGTTALASEMSKRKWIGIELSPSYCEMIKKRIEEYTSQLKMF